jgi:hypothetical protein
MPVLEIEIGDDGAIGKLPDPLQKFLDKRIDEAFRKGADKTERALSPLTVDPVEMERLRGRDKLLSDHELKIAERDKEYEKARKLHEDAAAREKAEAVKAEKAQTAKAVERVKDGVRKTIRAAALANGARAESLDELERLLAADIDLDAELNEYVVDAKDRKAPRLGADGQPVTVEGLVADYLTTHPHHVAAAPGAGGGARGGATFAGRPPVTAATDDRSKARQAVLDNPSTKNVGNLLRHALTKQSA